MKMPYTITNNSLTVIRNGMPHTILKEHPSFNLIINAIKEDDWVKVIELMDNKSFVKIITEGKIEERNGELFVALDDGKFWKVPPGLGDHILEFHGKNLPYQPWVEFAKKLQKNPSYRSVNELFDFLSSNNFTLTETGNFIAYKRVKEDFKDIYSGTFDNSIGVTVSVPRNEVDEDSERTCSNGLHVAAFDYACNHFGSKNKSTDKLLYVEVDPRDVVAVPKDYNNQKMRVCEYKVLGVCDYEFKEPLYSKYDGFYGSDDDDHDEYEEWQDEEDYDDDYEDDYEDDENDCCGSCKL